MSIQKPIQCKKDAADMNWVDSKSVLFERYPPLISSHKCGLGDVVTPFAIKGKNLEIVGGLLQGKNTFFFKKNPRNFLN